ncbi:hypothetical protein HT031_000107 [Scenedesmus sp. PABB004]|nr:hypothetical protein HT031_000107 [Scenedesmus sp. PABB004]
MAASAPPAAAAAAAQPLRPAAPPPLRAPGRPALASRSTALERPWRHARPAGAPAGQRGRGAAAAAAAAPGGAQPQPDAGLEAFKALIGTRRFTCTQCGKCCTGDGEVWVSDAEAARIAAHLNLALPRFLAAHTRGYSKLTGWHMLRSDPDSETRDCTFLRPDNTCAIHAVRPLQCSTYPWWPELMAEQEWQWERENICEGFDHADAPPTDLDEAARQLRLATVQETHKLLAYKPSKRQQQQQAQQQAQQQQQQQAQQAGLDTGSSSGGAADWQQRLTQLEQLLGDD